MAQVNQTKTATTADIAGVLHRLAAERERHLQAMDGLAAALRALLPPYEDQARHQRIKTICRDRAQLRAVLREGAKI